MKVKMTSDFSNQSNATNIRYQLAQYMLQGLRNCSVVHNDQLEAHWISGSSYFWYESHRLLRGASASSIRSPGCPDGHSVAVEYRLYDVEHQSDALAFDHQALAAALTQVSGQTVDADALPLKDLSIRLCPLRVEFSTFSKRWQFCDGGQCREIEKLPEFTPTELPAPDGNRLAFTRDHNLWLRSLASGEEVQLTQGGTEFNCFGAPSSAVGVEFPGINALWSRDSKRLFTLRRDSRRVRTTPLVNHLPENGQIRPTIEFTKVAYPGDKELEQYHLLCLHVDEGRTLEIDFPPIVAGSDDNGFFSSERRAWWSSDNRYAWFVSYLGDGYQVLRVMEVDTDTGKTRTLLEENSETFVNYRPEYCDKALHRYLPETNELVWWSQRSGYGHLYLYDLARGVLVRALTEGGWVVRNILQVDTKRRELLIQTAGRVPGRNPYYRDICRVRIDTGELTSLVSSDHEYGVNNALDPSLLGCSGVSPDGQFLVATRSRVDQPPVHLLLDRSGEVCVEVERACLSGLPATWRWPEPFEVLAADQLTLNYGVLFRPSVFTDNGTYPVVNMIVSGPWLCGVPHGSFHNSRGYNDRHYFHAAALAELGFMVMVLDTRGTPLRSKSYQDTAYGWIPDGARTEDHRAALEQLAMRYPQMDLARAGVYAPTGYHGGIQNLFECPDLYRVGVVNNSMDSRLASRTVEHADKYQGGAGPSDKRLFPEQLAQHWQGKLLLLQAMSGVMAAAYAPAASFRLIKALQQAGKEVDLVITPRFGPGELAVLTPYAQRRVWDYLVEHLRGETPPQSFELETVPF